MTHPMRAVPSNLTPSSHSSIHYFSIARQIILNHRPHASMIYRPCRLLLLTSLKLASPPANRSGSTSRKPLGSLLVALELLRRLCLLLLCCECLRGGLCSSMTTTSSSSSSVTMRGGGGAAIGGIGWGGGGWLILRSVRSSRTTLSASRGGGGRLVRISTVSRRAGLRW